MTMRNKTGYPASAVGMDPKVDLVLSKAAKWREESGRLRRIVLDCQLTEHLKWNQPCYTYGDSNVVIISGFKDYCALGFFKGALLQDAGGLMHKPGENSQSMRQFRFTDAREITEMEPILKAYIYEAIEVEKAGLKIDFVKNDELQFPDEFQKRLEDNPALRKAFESLTPGRQRAYNLYFSAPKQPGTRALRVEKYEQQILSGKGLNDT